MRSPNLVSPIVVDISEFFILRAESLKLKVFLRLPLNGDYGEIGPTKDLSKSRA